MRNLKVLTIEDDLVIRDLVELTFLAEGATVLTANNGIEGVRRFYEHQPDIVLLDISMPEMDGWETLRRIRMMADTPVIIITARSQDQEVVQGLSLGADDYVTKPFSPTVLVARAKSVLRRQKPVALTAKPAGYQDQHLFVSLSDHRVVVDGARLKLTGTELRLLEYLVANADRVLTFRQILENVWGWEYQDEPEQVRLYIWRLRQKVEADPKNPRYILTEYGIGYRFEAERAHTAHADKRYQ